MWNIVFRAKKQWDYCCQVLICMVKTKVRSLRFTRTDKFSETTRFLYNRCKCSETFSREQVPSFFAMNCTKHKVLQTNRRTLQYLTLKYKLIRKYTCQVYFVEDNKSRRVEFNPTFTRSKHVEVI